MEHRVSLPEVVFIVVSCMIYGAGWTLFFVHKGWLH